MIADSLKIRKNFGKYDSALRLAFSFFQPLHLLFEILVAHVVCLLLHDHCLFQYTVNVRIIIHLHIFKRIHALLFHLAELFKYVIRELQFPLLHIIRVLRKVCRVITDSFQVADNRIITVDLPGIFRIHFCGHQRHNILGNAFIEIIDIFFSLIHLFSRLVIILNQSVKSVADIL